MSFWNDLSDKMFGKDDLTQSIVEQNQAVANYVANIGENESEVVETDNTLLYSALGITGIIAIGTIVYFSRKKSKP